MGGGLSVSDPTSIVVAMGGILLIISVSACCVASQKAVYWYLERIDAEVSSAQYQSLSGDSSAEEVRELSLQGTFFIPANFSLSQRTVLMASVARALWVESDAVRKQTFAALTQKREKCPEL